MDWKDLLEIAGVFVLSAIKFGLAGVPSAVFANWSFLKVLTVTVAGGTTGAVVFTYVSEAVILSYKKVKRKLTENKIKEKPKFTFTNKIIVKTKRRLGLLGLAILTPSLLSIPLGVFLGVRYYKDKKKVISYMIISILAWAVVLYFFYNNIYHRIFS
jgi:hypothetical protein